MEEDNSEEGSASDEEVGIPHAHHPHPVIPSHIVTNASFTLAVLSLAKTIMGSGMLVGPRYRNVFYTLPLACPEE